VLPPAGDAVAPFDEALMAGQVAVQDRFLTQRRVRDLCECAHRRRERGEFRPARVGAERRSVRHAAIRGDLTCWLDEPLFPEERLLMRRLEALRLRINLAAFLGLFDFELHYAWYPPQAGYARHVDQLQGSDQRVVTVILYLNQDWRPGAGGELRIFGPCGHRDIEPVAGRLVCFLSAGLEHAVLPTRAGRLSLTGWFRRRPAA
jgi:SM-20-related protein